MTDFHSGTAQVTRAGGIPIDPTDGAAHLFVDPVSGDDENIGLSAAQAFQTIGRAVQRMNEWLQLAVSVDLVIELANGTYNEDVAFIMAQIPQRRVFMRGDSTTMTVLASGALTAATAQLVTDAGAAFGVANQYAGRIIEVFDPLAPATTLQQKTIRSHTATAVSPVGPFSPVPLAGWTYRILDPAVVIVGQASGGAAQNSALSIVLPWVSASDGNEQFPGGGPMLGLMFIKVTSAAFTDFGIRQIGGSVWYTGVVCGGAGNGLRVLAGTASFQGGFPGVDDPIYGTTLVYSPNIDACIGTRTTGGTALRADIGATLFGSPVAFGDDIFLQGGAATFFGGAVHGAMFDQTEQSEVQVFGGGVNAVDPLLPFLFRAAPAVASRTREGTHAEMTAVVFQVCLGDAFTVQSSAFLRLLATIAAGGGDVAGIGVNAQDGGKALVGSVGTPVTFTTGGTNLVAGAATLTFAGLAPATPVTDYTPSVPGSLAVIWQIP